MSCLPNPNYGFYPCELLHTYYSGVSLCQNSFRINKYCIENNKPSELLLDNGYDYPRYYHWIIAPMYGIH